MIDLKIFHTQIIWLIITYAAVIFAMIIDLCSGLRKAKELGILRTSQGLKKTADKATKYFLPMLCLLPLDMMASGILSLPIFTMLMAAFCIICEFKSVMEKAYTKKEMAEAANTISVIVQNKEDLAKALGEILNDLSKEGGDDKT